VLEPLAALGVLKALMEPPLPRVPGQGLLPFLAFDCLPTARQLLLPEQNNWNAEKQGYQQVKLKRKSY